ncbi:MAG: DUF4160 domain-containing protein [Alcaligenaceae bacterium]|nr:DUF4160 domain-containing protein [Alcaligenaceae bacterium]
MPTLQRFHDSRVLMYHGDHPPPHVHIQLRSGRECIVHLHTLKILGAVSRHEIREPLIWITTNLNSLFKEWRRYNP